MSELDYRGADDSDVEASIGRTMAEAMPNGRIEVLAAAGHLPWIDDPDRVADHVRAHVDAAWRAGTGSLSPQRRQ